MTTRARAIVRGLVLAAVLTAVAHSGPAYAQGDTLAKIKSSGTLTIGYRESSVPFSFTGQDKRPTGYSIDMCLYIASFVQKAAGLADLKVNWVPVTPENRIQAVAGGSVDIECGSTTASLSRHEQVDFSLPTFVDGGSLLVKRDSSLRGLGDLAGKKIAVASGTTTEKALADFLKGEFVSVQTVKVKDHAEGLAALDGNKVDAYASDRGILVGLAVASGDVKKFGLANVVFSYEPYAFPLRRNDAAFRLVVNRAIADLYRSAKIVPIYDKWFGAFGKPSVAIQAMYQLNALPE
jgi:ABC-type amino acid transport substrate-binding protein